MALITNKQLLLDSYMKCAQNGWIDKSYLLVKLQGLVTDGDLTQEEVQPIVDIIMPPEPTEVTA